jgi:phosphoribosylglycinamide formyltransferase-1
MGKIAILASGNGTNARNIARSLKGTKICCLICNKADAGAVDVAREEGIPCHIVGKAGLESGEAERILDDYRPDLLVLAGFLLMVPSSITERYPTVNIHPSLLPKFGGKGMHGMNVHRAAIEAGEKESGITIHWANARYDEGEIIEQHRCPVLEGDTPESLSERVRQLEMDFFPSAISRTISNIQRK